MTRLRVKPSGDRISLQAAISHNPCDGCHRIVGNVEIVSRFCGTCEYGEREEVNDPEPELKAQGDGPSPEKGDGGLKPKGPEGQLKLI